MVTLCITEVFYISLVIHSRQVSCMWFNINLLLMFSFSKKNVTMLAFTLFGGLLYLKSWLDPKISKPTYQRIATFIKTFISRLGDHSSLRYTVYWCMRACSVPLKLRRYCQSALWTIITALKKWLPLVHPAQKKKKEKSIPYFKTQNTGVDPHFNNVSSNNMVRNGRMSFRSLMQLIDFTLFF